MASLSPNAFFLYGHIRTPQWTWSEIPQVIAHKQAVRQRLNEWWARAVRPIKRPMTQIEAMQWAVETALGMNNSERQG